MGECSLQDEDKSLKTDYAHSPFTRFLPKTSECIPFLTIPYTRQIYAKRLEMCLDWCFATNQQEIDLDGIIQTYRGRWNIETGFRVQDEATIKSKSKDVRIRFFLFAYEQMLQLIWSVFYKEEGTFKGFLIEVSDTCSERLSRAEERASRHTS